MIEGKRKITHADVEEAKQYGISDTVFEMTIKDDTPQLNVDERFNLVQGHVRVGWSRSQAKLQV